VTGVVIAQRVIGGPGKSDPRWLQQGGISRFAVYCLWGGWIVVWVTTYLGRIPSLGAAIEKGGNVWILGVLIGFLASFQQRRLGRSLLWLAALSVYPLYVLIWGGFLSFGSTSVFVVMSALLVMLKSHVRAYAGVVLFSVFCFLAFMSYFQNREETRANAREGAGLEQRVARSALIITELEWFDSSNLGQLTALDMRLNQNQFVGMAAQNIASGRVSFLHGRSVWQGLQALVPRALWAEKPIFAGSSQLIRELTDFEVNETTTYGTGLVMDFYVNFGVPSLVVGFLLFGFAYGWIDRNAAAALQGGEFGRAILWFLPGVAMNAPLDSIAEVVGSIAAALVGAYGWRYAWGLLDAKSPGKPPRGPRLAGSASRKDGTVPAESK
jgi:Ca2+/Na+ antiporter